MTERHKIVTAAGSSQERTGAGVWINVAVSILLCLVNLFVVFLVIPRFSEFYHDVLGDEPLPPKTAMVIDGRWLLAGLACGWPMVAILLRQRRHAAFWIFCLLSLSAAQAFFTVDVLVSPACGTLVQAKPDP